MTRAAIVKTLRLSKAQRDAALAKLRETFGGPPPEDLLRRAREQARSSAPRSRVPRRPSP